MAAGGSPFSIHGLILSGEAKKGADRILFGFRNRTFRCPPTSGTGEQDAYTITFLGKQWICNREHLRRLLDALKHDLRMKQRVTIGELRQLAEAIIDYGRIQAQEGWPASPPLYIIVDC